VRNVQQSAGALLGITLAFSIVPGIFATLKAAALWAYPLSRREVLRIEGELDARRQPAAATPA
jgi:Na+/melibiose symporter-like transporter